MFDKIRNEEFLKEFRTSQKYAKIREELDSMYEQHNITPMPLLFSKMRMFSEIGERPSYEIVCSQHYMKLTYCAYKAIVYGDDKYIRELEDCIFDICDMYVWAYPAHIPDINTYNYCELDLFATAIGASLATIYYMIGDKLHPLIKKRIEIELRRRILEPFKDHIWHWEDRYNNWTAVCAGNTGSAIMLAFPDEFEKLKDRFAENMRKYLVGFMDDGVCIEGAGYWGYGFSSFVMYAYLLRSYSNGKDDYFKNEKVKNISSFPEKVMLYPDVITNYGDCPATVKFPKSLLHTLKTIYGDIYMPPENLLYFKDAYIHTVLMYIENFDDSFKSDKLKEVEYNMDSTGWYLRRTKSYSLGARGGTNGESHNHNDVGSFIFAMNNKQIICDMGGRQYTKDYFTDVRYKYIETSSRGHNVPIINGQYQANVPETFSYTSFENGVFSIDFKELYDIKELKKLVRHIKCLDTKVLIKDDFTIDGSEKSFTERLISYEKPKISDGVVEIDGAYVKFDESKATASYSEDEQLIREVVATGEKETRKVYCIDIKVTNPIDSFEFTIDTVK